MIHAAQCAETRSHPTPHFGVRSWFLTEGFGAPRPDLHSSLLQTQNYGHQASSARTQLPERSSG